MNIKDVSPTYFDTMYHLLRAHNAMCKTNDKLLFTRFYSMLQPHC